MVFENVSATYPKQYDDAIKEMSFVVEPGQKIGLIGKTGAGKSSLIKLLWKALDPKNGGKVVVDGVDLATVDLKKYRRELSIIS